jgi:hypothetical protein
MRMGKIRADLWNIGSAEQGCRMELRIVAKMRQAQAALRSEPVRF